MSARGECMFPLGSVAAPSVALCAEGFPLLMAIPEVIIEGRLMLAIEMFEGKGVRCCVGDQRG